jgi:hypothetical protein
MPVKKTTNWISQLLGRNVCPAAQLQPDEIQVRARSVTCSITTEVFWSPGMAIVVAQ